MMATKGKRPMRALTPGDKIEAIQRVNDGESKASVARDIGVPESTLRGWCKNEDKLRYMTSRLSSPDTDRSNDEPPDKRARSATPPAASPPGRLLDLTAAAAAAAAPPADAPVELTTRRADTGASASMSAVSPLSGLHLPPLAQSHLGLSFNEIANNLTLLAQLGPSLAPLTAQPPAAPSAAARGLRSVRSPKPAHNLLNLGDTKHRSKHHSDPYRAGGSKAGLLASAAGHPVDDTLWYWLKAQQAMLDLTAQTTPARGLQLGKLAEPAAAAPIPPAASHLDYNRNPWMWQYCKEYGGAMPPPEDKLKSAAQVPKEKTAENILYSHLTKDKIEDLRGPPASPKPTKQPAVAAINESRLSDESRVTEPIPSPDRGTENKEPSQAERAAESRPQSKARNVLDNLLFQQGAGGEARVGAERCGSGGGEAGAAAALEHGDKFLAWLEASGDPSVTRMHVHQLRSLLHNLRARRDLAPAAATPAIPATPDPARRK